MWDSLRGELLWVDIRQSLLRFYHLSSGVKTDFSFDSFLGAAVLTEKTGRYVLALQKGLAFFERNTGGIRYFAHPEKDIPENRFNDGKCDPGGRFWIGSMDLEEVGSKGALYRVDQDLNVMKVLSGVSISNGLAWDRERGKMYYIDSPTCQVVSFDFDFEAGSIGDSSVAVSIPKEHGFPDGMCIDAEGMLWIAHWGGANVSRWNPRDGRLLRRVEVPALHVTNCCFGGSELDTLYITSARQGLSQEDFMKYPHSGSVFSFKPGVQGVESARFKEGLSVS